MTDTVLEETTTINTSKKSGSWPERAAIAAQQYHDAFKVGSQQFSNAEMARERAAFTRWKAIENLDKYLIEFEANFIKSGGKVIWAQDITDALSAIQEILKKSANKLVLKSKTSMADEIGLKGGLLNDGYRTLETDTGDYIADASGDHSGHMILPAIHKSLEEIGELLKKDMVLSHKADANEIVAKIRQKLRGEFLKAGTGITGCNFLVADPGAIVLTENEGNAQLTASLPKTHIVLAGIEKILPSMNDLDLFLPLVSTYGTGQEITTYNSIITGPKQSEELDGPEELYVILLDNGRSEVLSHEIQRQAMTCIKCGACQFSCPVYLSAGGGEFSSPLAAVTIPLQSSNLEAQEQAIKYSTLCGSSREVCPVKIDFPRLLLQNRKLFIDKGLNARSEKLFYFFWKKAMMKRDIMNWKGIKAGKYIMESLNKSRSGLRDMPTVVPKSFNEQWREKMNFK
jgi:L-lactate dehydrogenase complex protein LldF